MGFRRKPSAVQGGNLALIGDVRGRLSSLRLSRRQFLYVSSATAATALLAACGGDDEEPPAATQAATSAPSGGASATTPSGGGVGRPTAAASPSGQAPLQPKSGGTLVTPVDTDPPSLLSSYQVGTTDNYVGNKSYEPLLRVLTANGDYEGVLAKSWELGPDGKTWTFKLQEGVKWHDGQPFSSADVKFTFEVISQNQARTGAITRALETIETPDANTAVFKFKQPFGPFLSLLNASNGCIGPKHIFENVPHAEMANHPAMKDIAVGTGPFKMKTRDRGQRIVYEKNKEYWQPGKPYLDSIISPLMPDTQARILAFEAGEIDYIADYWLPKEQYLRLSKLPGVVGNADFVAPSIDLLHFNLRREIPNNKMVRKAIFHAIDRKFLNDKVWFNLAETVKSAIPQHMGWPYNPEVDLDKMYAYDPAVAKKMLDDAGFPMKGSSRFALQAVYDSGRAGFQPLMESLKAQLKEVGVEVNLVGVERQGMTQQVFMDWDFDITYQTYGTFSDPTSGVQRAYITATIGKSTFNNCSSYSNPKVDELFLNAANSGDQETRKKFFWEVQPILAEDIPAIPLFVKQTVAVAKDYVKGFWHSDTDTDEFAYVWINK